MTKFSALGVITDIQKRPFTEVDRLIFELERLFNKDMLKKSEIIVLLKNFLPNFEHEEKHKNLDERM